MKTNLTKGVALLSALSIFGLGWIVALKAQPIAGTANPSSFTTNWLGCLVVGKGDPMDNIVRGPSPTTMRQVEIGLRSDGVVVWQNAENK